ncbi:MAG: hypothetical protein J7L42_00795 [Elusimicrobia bacterium]|nr:hypothetical protein [Elusimicrobiota bacterium]
MITYKKHCLFFLGGTVLFLSSVIFAQPSWYISPPESKEFFYFFAKSTSAVKQKARLRARQLVTAKASSYIGKFFKREKFKILKDDVCKDIKSNIYTCYVIARYPRRSFYEDRFIEEHERKKLADFFEKAKKKARALIEKGKIIEAINELAYARKTKGLSELQKEELTDLIKDYVKRVNLKALDYPKTASTKTGLPGEIGVIAQMMGEVPISELEVRFSFTKNSGYIEKTEVKTDKNGVATTRVLRINRPGEAQIQAEVSTEAIPEFSQIPPALFNFTAKGAREIIAKGAVPVLRGSVRTYNLLLVSEENKPVGLLTMSFNLKLEEFSISFSIQPLKSAAGISINKQAAIAGIKIENIEERFSIAVARLEEGKVYTTQAKPFEFAISPSRIRTTKIKHPLKGEIKTAESLVIGFIIYYL